MQSRTLFLLLLLAAAGQSASVYTQYSSAWDTSLGLRAAIVSSCRDLYATPRMLSDAQFLFRELPGLDGSAGGVSLMPAANDGFFLCAEGNDTDRLVAVRPAVSASLCTFRKVAGLSNPALVSFEQRGRYVGYAGDYAYDCAGWFSGRPGWTVGLVERPTDARLASWVAAESPPLAVYVQDTSYWLCACNGSAVFRSALSASLSSMAECLWDVVPALGGSATTAVSLRLCSSSASGGGLYLGVGDGEQLGNDSASPAPLVVRSCPSGSGDRCTWTAVPSALSGVFALALTSSGWALDRLATAAPDSQCANKTSGRAVLSRGSAGATLGFLRANYTQPRVPAVVHLTSASSASTGASGSSRGSSEGSGDVCEPMRTCSACTAHASCGWCSDTDTCAQVSLQAPRANCSLWFSGSCTPPIRGSGADLSVIVPLAGGVGGALVVLSAVVVAAYLVRRILRRPLSILEGTNEPVEGPSVGFVSAVATDEACQGPCSEDASGMAVVALPEPSELRLQADLSTLAASPAMLAPLSLTTATQLNDALPTGWRPQLGAESEGDELFQVASSSIYTCELQSSNSCSSKSH
eukprot:m51a1_g10305 hypothetical protein (581) ;mRNA; r:72912-74793